jgi:sulfotransferase family protein
VARGRVRAGLRLIAGRLPARNRASSGATLALSEGPAQDAGPPFEADAFESQLAWILGSPRTGSTWILRLLIHPWILARGTMSGMRAPLPTRRRDLPSVIPIDETYLLQHLAPLRPLPDDLAEQPPTDAFVINGERRGQPGYFFSDGYEGAWRPELRRLVLARLHAQAQRAAREHGLSDPLVLIKEPNGSHAAELLMSLLPRSRMIFVLRDGRDVIDSLLDARAGEGWILTHTMDLSDPSQRLGYIRRQSRLWLNCVNAVEAAYAAHPDGLRRTIRYEDLLSDPLSALRPLADWLGLSRDDDALREAIEVNAFDALPRRFRGPGTPRRAATPGLWRQNMSAREQEAMLEIIGPKLAELGYEVG